MKYFYYCISEKSVPVSIRSFIESLKNVQVIEPVCNISTFKKSLIFFNVC
jgi:hypothetical protein